MAISTMSIPNGGILQNEETVPPGMPDRPPIGETPTHLTRCPQNSPHTTPARL